MGTFDTTVDKLGDVITDGLRFELKRMVKSKLYDAVDDLLEQMAIEIAENIVVRAESMKTHDSMGFGPTTQVVVHFGLKEPHMIYDTATKTMRKREVLKK